VEHFDPVASRHRGLKWQRVEHIIDGMKRTHGFLFCGEVYGQDIHRMTPLEANNAHEEELSNS
jgi:hypothetical protein